MTARRVDRSAAEFEETPLSKVEQTHPAEVEETTLSKVEQTRPAGIEETHTAGRRLPSGTLLHTDGTRNDGSGRIAVPDGDDESRTEPGRETLNDSTDSEAETATVRAAQSENNAPATRLESRPRLAFFIPTMNLGGAQQVTVTMANGLAARGYAVDLVLARGVGPLLDRVDESVTVVDLGTPAVPVAGILAAVPALRRYLRRERPDVLFAAMMNANVVSVLADAVADVETAVVLTEHNTFGVRSGLKDRLTAGLASLLYPRADRVVGVSQGVADSVVAGTNVDDDDVAVLYNPIDVDAIRDAAAGPLDEEAAELMDGNVIFTVGRLEPAKDHPTLLRAFRRVREERPDVSLVVGGSGSQRAALEELATELGIADDVTFVGYVDNAYAYMAAASVFVLSSKHEGLPTVLLEALACETPIVSTDCPSGPREILADGRYGPLAPVGDDAALAEGILTALDAPVPAAALGTRAEDFSLDAALSEYESFIADVTRQDVDTGA